MRLTDGLVLAVREKTMRDVLFISLGAVLGANARYWLGGRLAEYWGSSFPYGTLVINLTGSLAIGFIMTLATERFLMHPHWRTLLTIGFLSAYTTFSTYTYESVTLMLNGHWAPGLLNLLGSMLLGALAVGLGIWLGKLM